MKKNIVFLLVFSLSFFFSLLAKKPLGAASTFEIVPLSYQGRFLPAENYATQWLYNLSHHNSLAVEPPVSPLDLLWRIHFFGHEFLDSSPLFWVQHKETRQLFGLNEKEKHFSYATLKKNLNQRDTNLPLVKKLLHYHFAKAFRSPENRAGRTTLELSSLASGLWIKWDGQTLSVLAAPVFFPWQWLTPNMNVANDIHPANLENNSKDKVIVEEAERLIAELLRFEKLSGQTLNSEIAFINSYEQLKQQGVAAKEIGTLLEQQSPLSSRLANAGDLFKGLPGKYKSGEWYSLHALRVKVFNPNKNKLELAKNFTVYPDALFEQIRETYFLLQNAMINEDSDAAAKHKQLLSQLLTEGYQTLAEKPYTNALGKKLYYPSILKLQAEAFYAHYPLTLICIVGYAISLGLYLLAYRLHKKTLFSAAFLMIFMTFSLHTLLLALRCYILGRPPVANMFETVLYVPWVSVLISLILRSFSTNPIPLIASAFASLILLTLLQLNFYASSLENVQAVLDSHYWLFIHVLMVVGSYGLFLLGCLLGHLYLGGLVYYKHETPLLVQVAQFLLKILYIGIALLIAGTLLGGVWAAQSWGRFWDWDPKESWAFISICIYMLWIHAYRFGKIHRFGLAVGSILGFLAISFTWYGVNYILGTGLHSYGFGNGGTFYYYSYLFVELIFLAAMIQNRYLSKEAIELISSNEPVERNAPDAAPSNEGKVSAMSEKLSSTDGLKSLMK